MLIYRFAHFSIRVFGRILFGLKAFGRENIPAEAAIFASNHLSQADPPLIGACLPLNTYYFAKEELFSNRCVGALLRHVHAFPARRGEPDAGAWKKAKRVLTSGDHLLFFPEGTRSVDGRIQPAKAGLARLAFAARVPVVPTVVVGSDNLRAALWRRVKLRVGFAPPVQLSEFDDLPTREERCDGLTERVMTAIAALSEQAQQDSI
ncbi:MAG: lysophospholipid acyltransferase family protein [bacterium]